MRKNLAASVLVSAVLTSSYAQAFVEDASDVLQQANLKPPVSLRLRDASSMRSMGEDSVRFLGKQALPTDSQFLQGEQPLVDQVTAYFQRTLGVDDGLELKAVNVPKNGREGRLTFVQSMHGVTVAGTYAMALVKDGSVTYAQATLVVPPKVDTQAKVSAEAAGRAALADLKTFSNSGALIDAGATRVIVYVGQQPRLAWQVETSTQVPYGTWSVFVDAHTGEALMRTKTSLSAVHGTVYGEFEPACQGDATERVAVPHVQWSNGQFTDADGIFESSDSVPQADVKLKGRYFSIVGLGGGKKSWSAPLAPTPAENEVTLDEASLGMLDPYIHADRVRTWARTTLSSMKTDAFESTMAWTEKSTPIITNISFMSCNAVYMPMLGGVLAFFGGKEGTCNNAGQVAKVVYHEYGHGVHHHLAGPPATFDGHVSEGAGDYVASTLTNNPDMTGLLSCDGVLPTGNKAVMRTCSNHYTYCSDAAKCDTTGKDEVHTTAPVFCGAWWDVREELSARYGADEGVAKADALFLKFLSLSTSMESAYITAIAADDDKDGDPSNGTDHSCEINNAFLGAKNGQPHFPDAVVDMVPCNK